MKRRILLEEGNTSPIDPTTGRGIVDGYEVVDLGLPSGLLWATKNVNAYLETSYGNYYMYGAGNKPHDKNQTVYMGSENPLSSSADTATQVMGSSYRMPTNVEFQELIDNTDVVWWNNGAKFMKKTDHSIYVFFPSGGKMSSISYDVGTIGYYHSSTPAGSGYQYRDYQLITENGNCRVEAGQRVISMSIRGVHTPLI